MITNKLHTFYKVQNPEVTRPSDPRLHIITVNPEDSAGTLITVSIGWKGGSSYTTFWKKLDHILAKLKKGAIRSAQPYYTIYREIPRPPPSFKQIRRPEHFAAIYFG